ncbi:MAG TPA: hypothetical protein VI757_01150 [Bacteroidia bacterium]|nr:hypothetical protein [Bacteroidia bacterium]
MFHKDSKLTGFISGLVAPFIGLYVYYLLSFRYMSLRSFIMRITELGLLSGVISLSLIANLVLFFWFIRIKADNSSYGVIGATFIYGLIIVYLKFLR